MPTKRKREDDPKSHVTATFGDGELWHGTRSVIRPGIYGPTHTAILKKPRFRLSHTLPVSMAVKSAANPADVALLKKELSIFETLNGSPFICKCFGEEISYNNKGVGVHNLLLEHSYCNLGLLIGDADRDRLSEAGIRRITRRVLEGVSVMHSFGYVHCGLCPEIVLIFYEEDSFSAKIGDLGLAKRAKEKKKVSTRGYARRNLRYLAPEVVGEKVQEGPADVWAIGCIVIEMMTGKSLWNGKKDKEIEESLLRINKGSEVVRIPSGVSEEAYAFLRGCLDRKASRRPTAKALLNHPFVAFNGEEN